MTNKQVCEAFVNGATRGKSLHMFIEGNRLYSYGYHYVLGERLVDETIRINTFKYSPTAQRHISLLRAACKYIYINSDNLTEELRERQNEIAQTIR